MRNHIETMREGHNKKVFLNIDDIVCETLSHLFGTSAEIDPDIESAIASIITEIAKDEDVSEASNARLLEVLNDETLRVIEVMDFNERNSI